MYKFKEDEMKVPCYVWKKGVEGNKLKMLSTTNPAHQGPWR